VLTHALLFTPSRSMCPRSFRFAMLREGQGAKTLCIQMTLPNLTVDYFGLPADANRRHEWRGGGRYLNGFGREVPADIVKLYTRQHKENPGLRGFGSSIELLSELSFHLSFCILRSACTARWTRSSVEYMRRCGGKDGAVNYEDGNDVQEAARESRRSRSRVFCVRAAARSNSARASLTRPSLRSRSPRTLGSKW
jgi:hypothetical protein